MRIKELREKQKIKQKELAAAIGIAPNTLSQYENGKREPDIETVKGIAAALNVSVDCLLGQKEKPAPNGDELTEEEIRFLMWYRTQASEKEKSLLRTLAGDK